MRVLYLTNNPNLGSTARVLQAWIRLAQLEGNPPCIVVPRSGTFSEWLGSNAVDYLIDEMSWPDRRKPLRTLRKVWRVAQWARSKGVQAIHCNEHDVYPFGACLSWLLRCPIICHVQFFVAKEFCNWAFKAPRRSPDALVWTSSAQRQDCVNSVIDVVAAWKQHVIPLGLNIDEFTKGCDDRVVTRGQWGVKQDQVVIGTASALRPVKRIEDFIEVVVELASKHPNVVGVVAGSAPPGEEKYQERIFRKIESSGFQDRIICLGNLDHVQCFMQAIDVFVSTSEYETFGMSVCEAMACRKAVAAYAAGSVQEVVGDAGLIVDTKNLEGLKVAVEHLIADSTLREKLGEIARQRVAECFNPAKSFEQLKVIYQSLLKRKTVVSSN